MGNIIKQLHLLRAIACVGVVVTHAKFALWSGGAAYLAQHPTTDWNPGEYVLFGLDLLSSLGPQRVYVFFILSGFFLRYSARQQFCLRSYFQKRIWRIYPPLVVATLLSGGVLFLVFTYIDPVLFGASGREYNARLLMAYHELSVSNLLATLTCVGRGEYFAFNHQFWSLQHELLFYLLFPVYNLCTGRVRLGLMGLCVGLSYWLHSDYIFCQLFFLAGTLFYDLFRRGYSLPWHLPKWAYYACFGGLYGAIYLLSKLQQQYLPSTLTILLAFLVFEFLLTHPLRMPRPLLWLGNVSYSVYLNHMWVLMLCYTLLVRFSGRLVFYERWPYYLGAVVAVVGSSGLYYLVEKPIGTYLRRAKVPPAPAVLAAGR